MKQKINVRLVVLICIILLVGIFRIWQTNDHSPISNFTPIGALALFGGAYFFNSYRAIMLPILILLISDLVLMQTTYAEHSSGFLYKGWLWTYAAFGLMVFIGKFVIKKVRVKTVLGAALFAGVAHFLIVDFGVWLGGGLDVTTGLPYTRDFTGLVKCYTLAIPFFKNLLIGNILYGALLFGVFELAKYNFPVLKYSQSI